MVMASRSITKAITPSVTINGIMCGCSKLLISPGYFRRRRRSRPGGFVRKTSRETAKAISQRRSRLSTSAILRGYLGSGPIDVVDALTKAFAELNTVKEQLRRSRRS
jgi:hypothetical protein